MKVYHLEPERLKTLIGKWPYRKKKPRLVGIRFPKLTAGQPTVILANKQGEVLAEVMCCTSFNVTPTDTFFNIPIILKRSWWPLKGKANEKVQIQLILSASLTKNKPQLDTVKRLMGR